MIGHRPAHNVSHKPDPGFPPSLSPLMSTDFDASNGRPIKRARLSPVKRGGAGQENVDKGRRAPTMSKDEQALMDDLLSGLDASAFDDSPTKSQMSQMSQSRLQRTRRDVKEERSPLKAKSAAMAVGNMSAPSHVNSPIVAKWPEVKREPVDVEVDEEVNVKLESREVEAPAVVKSEGGVEIDLDLKLVKVDVDVFDEEFGDFDLDFDLGDLSAFDEDLSLPPPPKTRYPVLNPAVPTPPDGYAPTPWTRCTVDKVFAGLQFQDGVVPAHTLADGVVGAAQQQAFGGKTLLVKVDKDLKLRIVHLKESWGMLVVNPGDTINLITPTLAASPIVISSKCPSSYLILHPDLLITMTSIANAVPCPRRPVLNALVKQSGPQSKNVVYGNLLHALLQSAMQEQDFTPEGTQKRLETILKREEVRMDVWSAGLNVRDVAEELGERACRGFESFADKWLAGDDKKSKGDLHALPGDVEESMSILGLHDVEEDIWSPKWGLKGKIDVSLQASILRRAVKSAYGPKRVVGQDEETEAIAPLEIKTGKSVGVMAHRAQTMLYTLLMEDRYGVPVPAGLLYYSQLDTIMRVEAKTNEIRSLIMARNELAGYLIRKRKIPARGEGSKGSSVLAANIEESFLPPTLDSERECKNCYAQDACMLYRKAVDRTPVTEDDPIGAMYVEKVGGMSEADTAFFRKWETLLTVEEQEAGRFRSQLWTMTAADREKTGRCFANMVISAYSNDLGKSLAKIHRHAYTFIRSSTAPLGTQGQTNSSLLSGHIAKGDPVTLSIEPDLLSLARGFVLDLSPESVTIGVQHVIDPAALLARTTHRHAARQVVPSQFGAGEPAQLVFRIDKDEMASGMQRMRNNLAQLFLPGGNEKLRRIVVDHIPPRYAIEEGVKSTEVPSGFNDDQRAAMDRVLGAEDYALVLGMPGTGKTTTIAEIIRVLVERGKSVLLASYTHSAVDTILMKLVNEDFGILRLGNIDKVHPDVQHFTLEAMNASTSMGELEERLMGPPVVASTCHGIDHPLFHRRKFDYCIIDEASQITLPTCLGPLRFADRFVLVGDHYQLPPIVRQADARKAGLDVSLFRLLSDARPESVVSLTHQYRMNEDIMALSNRLVYEGRLRCGSEEVAKRGLVLPKRKPCGCGREGCWVDGLLEESAKAVFVDTDLVPAPDTRVGDLVQNPTEAALVCTLAKSLIASGIRPEDIAVITPYRQQIKLLTGLFRAGAGGLERVEILTADKSQGRDKDVVLISLVRSNGNGSIGELLRDWRRINVAFTRAKKKLVIFGSRATLGQDKLLADFFGLMRDKGWIRALPVGADRVVGHEVAGVSEGRGGAVRVKEEVKVEVKVELGGQHGHGDGSGSGSVKRGGKGVLGDKILAGKPFIKELLAGS